MGGWSGLKGVLPAAALCGVLFAGTQFLVSNFMGPELTDILASLAALGSLVVLLKVWKPKDTIPAWPGDAPACTRDSSHSAGRSASWRGLPFHAAGDLRADLGPAQARAEQDTASSFEWPGLHNLIQKMPPVTAEAGLLRRAGITFDWLSAAGTACLMAAILSALVLRMSPRHILQRVLASTARQLLFAELTIATVLGLAFLMNYSGSTATLGLAFAATGAHFPSSARCSAGWACSSRAATLRPMRCSAICRW